MATLRRIVFGLLFLVCVLLAAVFAYSNPMPIDIDIGIAKLEQVSMSLAFAAVFALGWLFGLISTGIALLSAAGERRRLRKDLKHAESELNALRQLPLPDAH